MALPITILTDYHGLNAIPRPPSHAWSADSGSIFFESSRPRPEGWKSGRKERQLMRVDLCSRKSEHLAPLEVEDTRSYGPAHLKLSSHSHFDYAPKKNIIIYRDVTGHNLYALDLNSGQTAHLWHESEGTLFGAPGVASNATMAFWNVAFPSTPNRYFRGIASCEFSVYLDPDALKLASEPVPIESRLLPKDDKDVERIELAPILQTFAGLREFEVHDGAVVGLGGGPLYAGDFKCASVVTSPDERWIAACSWEQADADKHGSSPASLALISVESGNLERVCDFRTSGVPFASFSPDGTNLAFNSAESRDVVQVACVDVGELVSGS